VRIIFICGFIFAVILAGCAFERQPAQITQLKKISDNHGEMDRFIQIQEDGYAKLQKDLKGNMLTVGTPKSSIISRYADPVFCKPAEDQASGEICLYRRPTEYFSSNVIFLYFNKDQQLESWESLADGNRTGGSQ
jgi:hypothetical protein